MVRGTRIAAGNGDGNSNGLGLGLRLKTDVEFRGGSRVGSFAPCYPRPVPKPPRTVYSTEQGRTCPRCGWPVTSCRCAAAVPQPVPAKPVVRLRLERAGRKGKTVTVVEGLPRNPEWLRLLAAELKRACGSGGTVAEDRVEIQGDHLERLRGLLRGKGWTVKG